MSVIGALMTNPALFPELGDLTPDQFYLPVNQILFTTLRSMYLADEKIDSITLFAKLKENQDLRRVGSAPYLADCLQAYKNDQNASEYARIVKDQWVIRRIHDFGHKCISIADTAEEVPQAVESVYQFLDSLEREEASESEDFHGLFERWDEWQATEDAPSIPTPWPDVNDALNGGLNRGRLYIVVARPGCGKSVAGMNMILQAAQAGYSTLTFSMEMGKVECQSRLIAAGARVKIKDIFARSLSEADQVKVQDFRRMWSGLNLTINDSPSQTIESIAAECRAHKQKHGLDVVFMDYAGLIGASDPKAARYLQMGHISKQAKILARKLDCAVILACQASRGVDNEERLPRMSDTRESGDLEADADCLMFLARGINEDEGMINIHFLKNRGAVPGRIVQLEQRFHQMRLGG